MGKFKGEDTLPVIAVAGNPNVGKSTVFNALTGMHQHTGNWTGKTVENACGYCVTAARRYRLVDLPGTYSLIAHSAEEEVARDFLCNCRPEAVIVVCDATCPERSLNLALQIMELTDRVLICVNLLDEAKRKGIAVNLKLLEERLGVPVVGVVAQKKRTLRALTDRLDRFLEQPAPTPYQVTYDPRIEAAVEALLPSVGERQTCLRLLEGSRPPQADEIAALEAAWRRLAEQGLEGEVLRDRIADASVRAAEQLCRGAIVFHSPTQMEFDRHLDRILCGRYTAYPLMLCLLALILWLTVSAANYPSALLADGLFWVQERLTALFQYRGAPDWLHGLLVQGAYRVLAWVVSVMLPPMAIFFPLFTLLEDAGLLPRIAYNLDRPFQRCSACGKQGLTMCMGFGCNAVGVTGCRIIDSPRERLLATLTNSFVPCNGRFPTLIALITMFFIGTGGGPLPSVGSALLLTAVILLGVLMTFAVSRLLSATLLKGLPSSFVLELPPYRRPQVGKVLLRSILDRTLFVLGRAAAVAAPAGLVLWLLANISVGDASLLQHCADFLDPLGRLLGMDGVILMAFILGFPANEIVLPIIMMTYLAQGTLTEAVGLAEMREILVQNGWTLTTAVCTLLFSLFHWPCSTTLLTVKKETGSWKWTLAAAALPTLVGMLLCLAVATISKVLVAILF